MAILALTIAACSGNETSVFDLGLGDCYNDDPVGEEIASVDKVPCSEPHDQEIYFQYSLSGGLYPGFDAVLEEAAGECYNQFAGFVGLAYEQSDLDVFMITPTSQSWEDGDRVVFCALYALDLSKLTGSMRGAAR